MVVPEWLIMLSIPLIITYQIAYFCDIALKLLNLLSRLWKKSEESFSFLLAFSVSMLLLMKFLFYLESVIVLTVGVIEGINIFTFLLVVFYLLSKTEWDYKIIPAGAVINLPLTICRIIKEVLKKYENKWKEER